MTHVLIDVEIVKALGLSIAFVGVILSIIAVGISFLVYRLSEKKGKHYLKMAGLITAWAVFLFLNAQSYNPIWMVYSLAHLISIFIGAATIIVFLFMFPDFWKKKIFDKKLLIIAGIIAILGLLLGIINPFFGITYLSLLQRILIIIPPLMGFFMIIKSYIEGKN